MTVGEPVRAASLSQSVLTSSGSTTTALQLPDLSGATGSQHHYFVEIPAGVANLVVSTEGGIGDVDLYAKAGSAPTSTDNDCLSETSTTVESCTIPHPQATTWHILLQPYAVFSGVTLKVTYETPVALTVLKQGSGTGLVTSQDIQARFAWPAAATAVTPRIVGGFNAQNESWPWQVQLSQYGMFHCGGSILSKRWVVTAAHCLTGLPSEALQVRAGTLIKGEGGQQLGVQRIVIHERYDTETRDNDIALLELNDDLSLSSSAGPIEPLMPVEETMLAPEGELATVTGWGATNSGLGSSTLRQVSVPIIMPESCRSSIYGYGNEITDNMVCAGYGFGEKDSCQGDSGGPMVVPNGRGGYVLAGIVSWGTGCARPGYPGVYTRAANYRGWIEQQTGLTFGQPLIDCGSACSAQLGLDSFVTLEAGAAPGSLFTGWSGDCSGTGGCRLGMNADKNVTALFTKAYTLGVTRSGNGTISSAPTGIHCGSTCSAAFADGASVSLSAQPEPGFAFAGWGGDCSSTGNCVVSMNADKNVSASFIELPQYPVKTIKTGTGVISSDPAGIFCGGTHNQCSASFSHAKLTANPHPGYEFIKWRGCPSPEGNVCTLNPTRKMTVQAVFRKLPKYTITIRKNTLGSVISAPPGLICGDKKRSCSLKLVKGTEATLTPVPQAGRSFAGWMGGCSGTDPCRLQMNGNKAIRATFQ